MQEFRNGLPPCPSDVLMRILPTDLDPSQVNDSTVVKAVIKNRHVMETKWMPNLLNDIFKYLEKRDLEIEIETLLNAIDGNRSDLIGVCMGLSEAKLFWAAEYVLRLFSQRRMPEFYSFLNRLRFNFDEALTYLDNLFSKPPQTLNEMRPDEFQLQQILSYTAPAGMNFQQQQAFNAQYAQGMLNIVNQKNIQLDNAEIGLVKQKEEHDEEIRFELEKQERAIVQPMTLGGNGQPQIDYDALAKNFIQQNHLVKTELDGEFIVYHWDNESKRYIRFRSKETLTNVLNSYAYEVYGSGVDIVKTQLDSTVNKMLYSFIPKLSAELEFPKLSSEMQVFFKNGYYDFQQRNFVETDTSGYFHIFSLPFEYDASAKSPRIFDKMLTAMFDNDRVKKKLAYQIIGAILSNVPLKYVFLLQGVSNGGKSTFAECIVRHFGEDEVKFLGVMDEVTESSVKSFKKYFKLLYIDEVPQSKWTKGTVSYIKSRSRGIGKLGFPDHKILLSTNYPILFPTVDGKDTSVENRIIVLPFGKDMKVAENAENLTEEERQEFQDAKNFLDEHFELERQGIVKKALEAFQEVLEEDKNFITNFPLNECVIAQASSDNKNSVDKIRELQKFIETNFESVDFEEFEKNPVEKGITPDYLLDLVNEALPNLFGSKQALGKVLREVVIDGDNVRYKDLSDKRYYNLRYLKDEEQ